MDIAFICFICIIWPTTITKSMHISHRFLKSFLLLQRYRKVNKSRYYVPNIFFIASNWVTIIVFAASLKLDGSESNLLF